MPQRSSFGEWIRAQRLDRKLSLRGLARLCGIDPSYLFDVEHGRKNASERVAQLLAIHLQLDGDETLLRAGHVPPDVRQLLMQKPSLCGDLRILAQQHE